MKPFHLIINADDFGYSPERDRGIIECFQNASITSASLMVNGVNAKQAADWANKVNLSIGLHLNLTEGLPVANHHRCSTLVNNDGYFWGKFGLRKQLTAGKVKPSEIKQEMISQIETFEKIVGYLPCHVDGHQHIHVYPGVREIFSEVLLEKDIVFTRLPMEKCIEECDWLDLQRMTFYQDVIQNSEECAELFLEKGIRFTSYFVGLSTAGRDMTFHRLQRAIDIILVEDMPSESHDTSQPIRTCELMVHPGYPTGDYGGCGDGPDDFSKSPDRQHEMNILQSSDFRKYLVTKNIVFSNFRELL